MTEHQFGGDWTQEKLERVRKYLPAYTTIMRGNAYAKAHYRTIYVDAFAGTGYRSERKGKRKRKGDAQDNTLRLLESAIVEREAFMKGSAVLALETDPPFDRYVFIEKNQRHARELEKLRSEHPQHAAIMSIVRGEANQSLLNFCKDINRKEWRAVMFLDPYGMQVDWSIIEAIAATRAVDLWLLFPLAQAVNRLLTKQPPPEKWAKSLTRVFGTDAWLSEFYPAPSPQIGGLFADQVMDGVSIKSTDFNHIAEFFVRRLKTVFDEVAPSPLHLVGPSNTPLYLLCFASQNKTAVKIANHLLIKK